MLPNLHLKVEATILTALAVIHDSCFDKRYSIIIHKIGIYFSVRYLPNQYSHVERPMRKTIGISKKSSRPAMANEP